MFIFYFAVASAITPLVALAAFAASTITKADPIITGFSAVRSGVVMFVIPFVFAFYPELLLIDAAVKDPTSGNGGYLPGYDGEIHLAAPGFLIARLVLALYLLSSALARFDFARLVGWEVALRLILAALIINSNPAAHLPAIVISLLWFGRHVMRNRRQMTPA